MRKASFWLRGGRRSEREGEGSLQRTSFSVDKVCHLGGKEGGGGKERGGKEGEKEGGREGGRVRLKEREGGREGEMEREEEGGRQEGGRQEGKKRNETCSIFSTVTTAANIIIYYIGK